jgi:hypothetical protein
VTFIQFLAVTPFLLVYLFVVDAVFLLLSAVVTPILILFSVLTCQTHLIGKLELCIDAIYRTLFGMQKMDVIGFRRLRTSCQLTFESLPQIILQIRIFIYLKGKPTELEELDISLEAISLSIAFALLHASIEFMFLRVETKANRTTMMHYLITCFNGRFGYVPFSHLFASNTNFNDLDQLNYDDIGSSMCCINFKMAYEFTEDTILRFMTSLTNLPTKEIYEFKVKVIAGSCLNKIGLDRFMDLL